MDYYLDENVTKTVEYTSPSGKYKLIIKNYNTSKLSNKSTWEYTQGLIYDTKIENVMIFALDFQKIKY